MALDLTKKYGPLPLWAYLAAGGGVLLYVYYRSHQGAAAPADAQGQQAQGGRSGLVPGPQGPSGDAGKRGPRGRPADQKKAPCPPGQRRVVGIGCRKWPPGQNKGAGCKGQEKHCPTGQHFDTKTCRCVKQGGGKFLGQGTGALAPGTAGGDQADYAMDTPTNAPSPQPAGVASGGPYGMSPTSSDYTRFAGMAGSDAVGNGGGVATGSDSGDSSNDDGAVVRDPNGQQRYVSPKFGHWESQEDGYAWSAHPAGATPVSGGGANVPLYAFAEPAASNNGAEANGQTPGTHPGDEQESTHHLAAAQSVGGESKGD